MNPRVIPTGVHGVLDYLASGVNLAFPRVLGLRDVPWAVLVPRIDGVAGASYSLLTDYELGALAVGYVQVRTADTACPDLHHDLAPPRRGVVHGPYPDVAELLYYRRLQGLRCSSPWFSPR